MLPAVPTIGSQSIPVECPVHCTIGSVQYIEVAALNGQLSAKLKLQDDTCKVANQFRHGCLPSMTIFSFLALLASFGNAASTTPNDCPTRAYSRSNVSSKSVIGSSSVAGVSSPRIRLRGRHWSFTFSDVPAGKKARSSIFFDVDFCASSTI